ncbi:hypothetical protein BKA64DRAFT_617173 [Cadophora sp. MPI-SDFR-AT-0126]|nr:hypothetical protein BKA64DRAFT_617173 [Leotiomycetes sp. MPI-SDFR-AT-0126]
MSEDTKLYGDITQPPPALPQPQLRLLRKGVSLLLPLSRRGHGPGLIILVPDHDKQLSIEEGIPSPLMKWAEEGYVVVEIQRSALHGAEESVFREAVNAIKACEKCDQKEKMGLVVYEPGLWSTAGDYLSSFPEIVSAVIYADSDNQVDKSTTGSIPLLIHYPGPPTRKTLRTKLLTEYFYPTTTSSKFAFPFQPTFHYTTEAVSHTRNLTFLKSHMGGPTFDLEAIWDEHTFYEFEDRSVEWTMSTMVQEPYVNHVPTLTGGVGRENLTRFYRENFIFKNSEDTSMELVSRTVGVDRVVDEFLFGLTHDRVVDWLLPGVPPTFKKASVPFTAIVNIRGDRLYHEHIAWDQGTLLRQLDLMPEYLPFPYALFMDDGGEKNAGTTRDKEVEYRVPVDGIKTAQMLRERNSVPSNEMFAFEAREVKGREWN